MRAALKRCYLTGRKTCLAVLRRLISKDFKPAPDIRQIKKLLFIRIDRIGDMILSTPVFKSLKSANPLLEITVLASPTNARLIELNPYVERVIIFDTRRGLHHAFMVIRKLRKFGFDLAIDPYRGYALTSACISFLSGAKWRVGYPFCGREIFFNIEAEEPPADPPIIDEVLNTLNPLGVHAKERALQIFISDTEKRQAKEWLTQAGIRTTIIIGVHPGAYYESQRWPAEYYADLIFRLQREKDFDVILFGGPADSSIISRMRARLNGEIPIHESQDLRLFLALIAECSLFICNNSGPLHMAAALGVPTISFMGPTVKERWMPVGDGHKVLRVNDLYCIGCNSGRCKIGTHDCMKRITPEIVLNKVADSLRLSEKTYKM